LNKLTTITLIILFACGAWAQHSEVSDRDALDDGASTMATDTSDTSFETTDAPDIDDYVGEAPPPDEQADPDDNVLKELQEAYDDTTGEVDNPPEESLRGIMQGEPEHESLSQSVLRGVAAMAIVLGLMYFLVWGMKKWGRNTPLLAGSELGQIIGRLHLDRKNVLYFVRTGGKVLVIGLGPAGLANLAEFDAPEFETVQDLLQDKAAQPETTPAAHAFLAQLRESAGAMEEPAPEAREEDEIACLKSDIQRLQDYLRENGGVSED